MSFKTILLIVLSVIVVSGIVFVSIQENQKPREKAEFKLSLQSGERHEVKLTYAQEVIQTYKDKMHKLDETMEAIVGFDVADVDANGTMNINFFYKSLQTDANTGQQHISYDSAKPIVETNDVLENEITELYSAVMGNKFSVKVSPTGKAGGIEGFDNITKKLEEKIRKEASVEVNDPNISEEDKRAMAELNKKFIETLIKQRIIFYNKILASIVSDTREMIDYIFIKYPDRPVVTGNKWYDKSELKMGMTVDANVTYIFKRKENGTAYIDSIYDVDMGKDFKITEINSGETVRKCISGARTATNAVDEATGLLQRSEAIVKFSGIQKVETNKMVLPIRPDMTIPIKIEGSMIIEMIK